MILSLDLFICRQMGKDKTQEAKKKEESPLVAKMLKWDDEESNASL